MKIKQKFLNLVRKKIKKHEYRLNDENISKLNIGDDFLLVSNENTAEFSRVKILDKKVFTNWHDALYETWKQDFDGLYQDIDSLIKECEGFYSKTQILKFGIVKFTIEPVKMILNNARVLLDTNIVIQRESHNNVNFDVMQMFKWFEKLEIKKFIHQLTRDELSKHGNETVRENILKKISSYDILVTSDASSEIFNNIINKYRINENSEVDNSILFQAFDKTVDFVITNDKQILDKANALNINDRVLSVAQILRIFEDEYPSLIQYKMLSVNLIHFGNINLNDEFFNTLKEDYPNFELWFKKKSNEVAYTYKDNEGKLKGFLYLKDEYENDDYSDIIPLLPKKRRLKIGTFKIIKSGFRLGERFMKTTFDNAMKKNVEEIYVTLFEKRSEVVILKTMLENWGFWYWGKKKSNGELVYVKNLSNYDLGKSPKFNFPNINPSYEVYFLPICPEFHTKLFPDAILKTEDSRLYKDNLSHYYSLEKIYISSAFNIQAKRGDLILIYRIGERWPAKFSSVVTSLCVLQDIVEPNTLEEYLKECSDKTIFSKDELIDFWNNKKYRTIIKLILYKTFEKKIILESLWNSGIIAHGSGPRPFQKITRDQFEIIEKLSKGEK